MQWPKARAMPAQRSTSSVCLSWSRRKSRARRTTSSTRLLRWRKVEDLANYDAIIVGAGTRFGRLNSQMANFLDQAGGLWMRGALHGKVGGAFTSTATQHGGQETTLFTIITNLLHFGMVIVGLDYGHAGQMTLDEITGGSPYGATTITGSDGSRWTTENELQGARYQGRKIAETAKRLHR
jgi:NAD(P)H dehydrogenase (quinone)